MKSHRLLCVLLCLIACSCNQAMRQSKAQQVLVPEKDNVIYSFDGSRVVSRLFLCDSNIVAFTLQEPFFSSISIEKKKVLFSFGRKGRARGEFPEIPQGINIRRGRLQFLDNVSKSLVSLSALDGGMQARPVPYDAGFRPFRMVEVEGKMIAIGGLDVGRVAYVDSTQRIVIGEEYPFNTGTLDGVYRGAVLQSEIAAAPSKPMVLIRTMASDCFEIYKVMESGIKRVFVNDFKYPPVIENNRLDPGNSKAGYIRSFVDDSYIYLMFSNDSYRESSRAGYLSDTIHIFDWDGNLNRIIHLPEKIGAFCVNGTSLYGTIELPDRSDIVEYIIN